ncbi:unnamed protein product [Angiostrongylus costaricensis]|uniref:CPSF_A domain-containing protein n=1 Tax=Angiostrongylus costaricensis TaxID=334426 RepID=A0A0R3PHJ4_ANGCS|nr:unnamed protein product [Angiostrongylus costaricensis]
MRTSHIPSTVCQKKYLVYNDCVQSWVEAAKEAFPSAPFYEVSGGYVVVIVILNNRQAFFQFFYKEWVLEYVHRTLRHVTLPEYEYTHQFLLSDAPDMHELNRQNSKLVKCIVEEDDDAAQVLTTLIEQLERTSLDGTNDDIDNSDIHSI